MTRRPPALCWACVRRLDVPSARCQAFPDGIPFEIAALAGDHHEPVNGDRGMQFVQADTPTAHRAYVDWQAFREVAD